VNDSAPYVFHLKARRVKYRLLWWARLGQVVRRRGNVILPKTSVLVALRTITDLKLQRPPSSLTLMYSGRDLNKQPRRLHCLLPFFKASARSLPSDTLYDHQCWRRRRSLEIGLPSRRLEKFHGHLTLKRRPYST
jgi:hypothetical protein